MAALPVEEWFEVKKKRCLDAGISFELTLFQFKSLYEAKTCFYSGIEFQCPSLKNGLNVTLDRIDCTKGYTVENTVPCTYVVNQLKSVVECRNIPVGLDFIGVVAEGLKKENTWPETLALREEYIAALAHASAFKGLKTPYLKTVANQGWATCMNESRRIDKKLKELGDE